MEKVLFAMATGNVIKNKAQSEATVWRTIFVTWVKTKAFSEVIPFSSLSHTLKLQTNVWGETTAAQSDG